MKYTLIKLGLDGQDSGIFYGACLPSACSDSLISNALSSAFKITKLPFDLFSLTSDSESYVFPMNWVSYLTTFLLTGIMLMVLVATLRRSKGWLGCFNFVSNMKHFHVREGEDLNIWDGVRALAMMWVVIGHVCSFWLSYIDNLASISHFGNQAFYLIVEAGILAVDVFFCLGGFFLAFIMLRHKINLKICGLGILQRALRVWPAYIVTMLFFYGLYMRMNHGPFWSTL